MLILLFEQSPERQRLLEYTVRACLDPPREAMQFAAYAPEDVFRRKLPENADAAFMMVNSMRDLEAARQFGRVYTSVPMVFVSNTPEYAIESFALGACHYLQQPLSKQKVQDALMRCERVAQTRSDASGENYECGGLPC